MKTLPYHSLQKQRILIFGIKLEPLYICGAEFLS
jgi:hypothetical protein